MKTDNIFDLMNSDPENLDESDLGTEAEVDTEKITAGVMSKLEGKPSAPLLVRKTRKKKLFVALIAATLAVSTL